MSTATLERADHELVAAVRGGDERAFEALYERYHRRIYAFVLGMVKDHGRAEDVTQEVFVSALRRMRATERPIAFKPWIYEIAKNACIDAFRRTRRAEEVSYDADEGLSTDDHRRLVGAEATPDAALAAKEDLETLCGAFGGLSDAHHEILVMRELEGLSYREIGERMGMSRPAVESTLFRARRRLTEEYGELVSGERCRRVQAIIAVAAEGSLGARDARRLARHVAHCQSCRREALSCGLDRSLIARPPLRRRVAGKIAAWLPFPAFLRGRRGGGGDDRAVPGAAWSNQLPAMSDQLSAGWTKAAAGVAVLLAGVGAGVGVQRGASAHSAPPAHTVSAPARTAASAAAGASAARHAGGTSSRSAGTRGASKAASRGSGGTRTVAAPARSGAPAARSGGGASQRPASQGTRTTSKASGTPSVRPPATPRLPAQPVQTVKQTVKGATGAVGGAVGGATGAVGGATGAAGGAVGGATGAAGGAVGGATGAAGGAVGGATGAAGGAVGGATGAAGGAVGGATGAAGGAVGGATGAAGGAVGGATGAAGGAVGGATGAVSGTVDQVGQTAQDTVGALGAAAG